MRRHVEGPVHDGRHGGRLRSVAWMKALFRTAWRQGEPLDAVLWLRRASFVLGILAVFVALAGAGMLGLDVTAQETAQEGADATVQETEEEKGRIIRFLENQLETEDRRVEFNGAEGLLSSEVTFDSIIISDAQGPWLRIIEPLLVWNRSALLRRRLEVDRLRAERIELLRTPGGPGQEETDATEIPEFELPVSVRVESIEAPLIILGAPVAGQEARLSASGQIIVNEEVGVDSNLRIERLDPPGGLLEGRFVLDPARGVLGADASYSEPPNGLVASILDIPGEPALSLALDGEGSLSDWQGDIALSADGQRLVGGNVRLTRPGGGFALAGNLQGSLDRLVPGRYGALFGGQSSLALDAVRNADGRVVLRRFDIDSGTASANVTASLSPDGFPQEADIRLRIAEAPQPTQIPLVPGNASVGSIDLQGTLTGAEGRWTLSFDARDLKSDFGSADAVTLSGSGDAQNLHDSGTRMLSFDVTGGAQGLDLENEGLDDAVGDDVDFAAVGAWDAGQPVRIASSEIRAGDASASFAGAVSALSAFGAFALEAEDLSRFSAIAGRDLEGGVDLEAEGTIKFEGPEFDLALDATGNGLEAGLPAADGLLGERLRLTGGVARTAEGFRFDDLRIESDALSARIDGDYAAPNADVTFEATISDLSAISERASGRARIEGSAEGPISGPRVNVSLDGESVTLMGRDFANARARFEGMIAGPRTTGEASLSGTLDGVPVDASVDLSGSDEGERRFEDIRFEAGGTRVAGDVTLTPENRAIGRLDITSPEIATVAPLFLADASGAVDVTVEFSAPGGSQSARVTGSVDDLRYEETRVGSAEIDLSGEGLLTAPILSGRFYAEDVATGGENGIDIESIQGTARREGERTEFNVAAMLADGRVAAAGTLQPVAEGGYSIGLDRLEVARNGVDARLAAPTSATFRAGNVLLDEARLLVDGGSLTLNGTVGEALALDVALDDLPAALANTALPALGATGTIDGTARLEGSPAAPRGPFDLTYENASIARLREAGVPPLDVAAAGELLGNAVRIDARIVGEPDIRLAAEGLVPFGEGEIDLDVTVESLPAALADTVAPALGARGTITGTADVMGTLEAPRGTFDVEVADASIARLREAGVPTLDVEAEGELMGDTVRIDARIAGEPGIRLSAAGRVPLDPSGDLDVTVNVESLPAALADTVAPDLGARGTITGTADLGGTLTALRGTFDVRVTDASIARLRDVGVPPLSVEAEGELMGDAVRLQSATITGTPGIRVSATGLVPFGRGDLDVDIVIESLPAALTDVFAPDLGARGTITGTADVDGTLTAPRGSFDLRVVDASIARLRAAGVPPITLAARGDLQGAAVRFDATATGPGGISVSASGTAPLAAEGPIDVDLDIDALPAGLADAFAPDLGVRGKLSGTASVGGTIAEPEGTFDLRLDDASIELLRRLGLSSLDIGANGRLTGGAVLLDSARATGPGGLSVTASGRVPLDRSGDIDIDVAFEQVPANLADAVAPDLDLAGAITGTANVDGPLANPTVSFDARASGLAAAPTRNLGLGALSVDAEGRFEDGRLDVTADVSDGSGVGIRVSGNVLTAGNRLDLDIEGSLPLTLANRTLASRGARLSGTLAVDLSITGTTSDPQVVGTVSSSGGGFVDPETGVTLRDIATTVTFSGERAFVESLTARSGDGTVTASGTIGIDPTAGFPADLRVVLENARYEDGELLAATLDADMTITGPLLRNPLVGGRVLVERAEIAIPERLPGGGMLVDVEHVAPPEAVVRTLRHAMPRSRPSSGDGGEPSGVTLDDLLIEAPNQIFVRGRGLDAELGGRLTLNGPVSNIRASGGFELIRGRLDVLARRITFERGRLDFVGDLDPFLDFEARTDAGEIEVIIRVTGRASDPVIAFSSDPDLPEDEVLAQLLFGQGLDDLSPLQLVLLANAAAELGGLSEGGGLLGGLRRATGLDDLDLVVDEEGNAAVRAGRYVSENVYLGVQQGTGSDSSRVTIDLDITGNIKARGELGADGSSSLGIFYEKEY